MGVFRQFLCLLLVMMSMYSSATFSPSKWVHRSVRTHRAHHKASFTNSILKAQVVDQWNCSSYHCSITASMIYTDYDTKYFLYILYMYVIYYINMICVMLENIWWIINPITKCIVISIISHRWNLNLLLQVYWLWKNTRTLTIKII